MRFLVGQDEEKSIVRLNQKLHANLDLIPPGASPPLVKPRSIDDVPILALTLSSKRYGDFELRRIAAQVDDTIKQVPDVSAVTLIGGQRREIRIALDRGKPGGLQPFAASGGRRAGAFQPAPAFGRVRQRQPGIPAGNRASSCAPPTTCATWWPAWPTASRSSCATSPQVTDGGEEPSQYVRIAHDGQASFYPAVTIAISKRKGTNAVIVAENVLQRIEPLQGQRHSRPTSQMTSRAIMATPRRRNRTNCCCTC